MKLPVFVKPAKGSASIGISRADTLDAVRFLSGCQEDMMIQEYMDGTEYGADVYVDTVSYTHLSTGCRIRRTIFPS